MSTGRFLFRQIHRRKLMSGSIRGQGVARTHTLYSPLASCNDVQMRTYADLSKQQVERFTYKSIARTIDLIKKVRTSESYLGFKQWMWNAYFWSIKSFKKHVVENPKVKSYSNDFQRKLEAAREERSKRA